MPVLGVNMFAGRGTVRCGTYHVWDGVGLQSLTGVSVDSIRKNGMQAKALSHLGHFLIHYDITNDTKNINAVPPDDLNSNGIPDFVDSVAYYFEYAYSFYKSAGYKPVYPDDNSGGSEAYDIYLIDLGKDGYYGLTYPGAEIPGKWKYARRYSFIVMDNNYSPYDSVDSKTQSYKVYKPVDFVKITSAHELHHAVQSLYGNTPDRLLHEMASTAMEVRLFPEIGDYISFVKSLFNDPASAPFGIGKEADDGYKYAIFGEFLYRRFGDQILRNMWEKVSHDMNIYLALDEAIKEAGSGLGQAWCEFMEWIYYTGYRAVPGKYFAFAADYPVIPVKPEYHFDPPSDIVDGSLYPFEFRFFRFCFPGNAYTTGDTLDIIVTNKDVNAAVFFRTDPKYKKSFTYTCADIFTEGFERVGTTDFYYKMTFSSDSMCSRIFQYNGALSAFRESVFPNPYRPAIDDALFIPAPDRAPLYGNVKLAILDESMKSVHGGSYTIEVINKYRGILVNDLPAGISSGVYIFVVESGNEKIIGKFTIIR